MIKKIALGLSILIVSNSSMHAKIIEYNRIDQILIHLSTEEDKQTLVIFDVDNTLVEPQTSACSSQWFEYMLSKKINEGIDRQTALEELLTICSELQFYIILVLVEQTTATVVQKAQHTGATVIALTGRSSAQADRTREQLAGHGIDFTYSKIPTLEIINAHQPPYYHSGGIIFCQTYSKAKALLEILKHLNYRPKKIIFIDDFLKHLHAVEQGLKDFDPSIEFIGIRYAYLDPKVTSFNPEVAERELEELQQQKSCALSVQGYSIEQNTYEGEV